MAQLDKLIERIQDGQEILLEAGKEPLMKSGAGSRAMINQQLSGQQIIGLLAEIAPSTVKNNLLQKKQSRFEYFFGNRTFFISFTPQDDHITAS
ncbi:MAG TPA: hypothetical protein VIX18_04255, partial [Nitrospirota bacterium]